jgi:hypothetical protein
MVIDVGAPIAGYIMKFAWLLPAAALVSCVSVTPYANFNLVTLDDMSGCQILFDGAKPYINHWKNGGEGVWAMGDNCPEKMSHSTMGISKTRQIDVGEGGHFARIVTTPDKKTGTVSKAVIRKNDGGDHRRLGEYRVFWSKVDL